MLKSIIPEKNHPLSKPNIDRLSKEFDKVCFFDSNEGSHNSGFNQYGSLLAVGATKELIVSHSGTGLAQLQTFCNMQKGWLFGFLSYDLKNETEECTSAVNIDIARFPVLHFFSPRVLIQSEDSKHILFFDDEFVQQEEALRIYEMAYANETAAIPDFAPVQIRQRITKEEYIQGFSALKDHIHRGNIYEINFCQEFYAERAFINPAAVYNKLNSISKAPFSAFCKFDDHYILSSSPERFLKKTGNRLISQPIKGTVRRASAKEEDEQLKLALRNDAKEQNENVMIVDLVRNDLSRIAEKGSVKVEELFGIYSFQQVHQMVSTISCELKTDIRFTDILRAAFPMGSMTGAPKIKAMQLIDEYEATPRGIYSGAIGYIAPNGNFDLSVVIRSVLYNASTHYLSFMTGSAITSGADAEREYEECLLKAKAMFEALKS